jgi:hypothetical protein
MVGKWGEHQLVDLLAEQSAFALALTERMGIFAAPKTLFH